MNLKEAFRYQNYLDSMFQLAQAYLSDRNNITKVTQEHMRSKANPDATDEKIDATRERTVDCSPDTIVDYLVAILEEKHALSLAVTIAKNLIAFNLDAEVAVNKYRQTLKTTLGRMCSVKPSERMTRGSDFKFNAEGNQVVYYYDVKENTSVDFDRNRTRSLFKKIAEEADKVSAEADRCIIETVVDFEPQFDLSDSFEDSLAAFFERECAGEQSYVKHAL